MMKLVESGREVTLSDEKDEFKTLSNEFFSYAHNNALLIRSDLKSLCHHLAKRPVAKAKIDDSESDDCLKDDDDNSITDSLTNSDSPSCLIDRDGQQTVKQLHDQN